MGSINSVETINFSGEEVLRKRSRTVTSKQALMADNGSLSSPTSKNLRPISSFFSSPKFFTVFSPKGSSSESESIMSPTSILDSKPFSGFVNPFWLDKNTTTRLSVEENKHHPWDKKLDSGGVGLGIVDALNEETNQKSSKSVTKMVVFGSQLKIQIPPLLPPPSVVLSPSGSPKSPADFGIKTRNSQFGPSNSGLETPGSSTVFTRCRSASEMELSEDYTCVIAHGPNPRTTHIFGDCVVENCCGIVGFSASKKENGFSVHSPSYPSQNFLSFCYNCKKKLGQGKDIFMYRGEKAFCSYECRHQEMMFDEGMDKSEL